MKAGLRIAVVALVALALAPAFALAEESNTTDGEYASPAIQVGWNSRVGDLVEVSFNVVQMPAGGLMSPTAIEDVIVLCKTAAAEKLSSYYRDNAVSPLRYYAVTISKGQGIGMYVRLYFEAKGDCTPVRLSSLGS